MRASLVHGRDGPAAERGRARFGKSILFEGAQGTAARHRPRHVPLRHVRRARPAAPRHGRGPNGHRPRAGHPEGLNTRVGEGPSPRSSASRGRGARRGGRRSARLSCARWATSFGVTTGRKRRCGWFDAVIARPRSTASPTALTKLDVLSAFDTHQACTAYGVQRRQGVYDYFLRRACCSHAKPVARGGFRLEGR